MAKKKRLSNEVKFRIADQMAANFGSLRTVERNSAFGVLINTPIKINGEETSLKKAFSEEDAVHITNLTLMRLKGREVVEVSL